MTPECSTDKGPSSLADMPKVAPAEEESFLAGRRDSDAVSRALKALLKIDSKATKRNNTQKQRKEQKQNVTASHTLKQNVTEDPGARPKEEEPYSNAVANTLKLQEGWLIGDRVQVRNVGAGSDWETGEVTQCKPKLLVRKDGCTKSSAWDMIRLDKIRYTPLDTVLDTLLMLPR